MLYVTLHKFRVGFGCEHSAICNTNAAALKNISDKEKHNDFQTFALKKVILFIYKAHTIQTKEQFQCLFSHQVWIAFQKLIILE